MFLLLETWPCYIYFILPNNLIISSFNSLKFKSKALFLAIKTKSYPPEAAPILHLMISRIRLLSKFRSVAFLETLALITKPNLDWELSVLTYFNKIFSLAIARPRPIIRAKSVFLSNRFVFLSIRSQISNGEFLAPFSPPFSHRSWSGFGAHPF